MALKTVNDFKLIKETKDIIKFPIFTYSSLSFAFNNSLSSLYSDNGRVIYRIREILMI